MVNEPAFSDRDGRPLTRINWLLRQLKNADSSLRMSTSFANTSATQSASLAEAHEDASVLLHPDDSKRDPRNFELSLSKKMGRKNGRGRGQGSFVADTSEQLNTFYETVVQDLKPPQPKPPKQSKPETTLNPGETPADEIARGLSPSPNGHADGQMDGQAAGTSNVPSSFIASDDPVADDSISGPPSFPTPWSRERY